MQSTGPNLSDNEIYRKCHKAVTSLSPIILHLHMENVLVRFGHFLKFLLLHRFSLPVRPLALAHALSLYSLINELYISIMKIGCQIGRHVE